jgi:hypothetical protein
MDKTYQELKGSIAKHKIAIDLMTECLYRKDPKTTGLKKTISALNKLQSQLNEESMW